VKTSTTIALTLAAMLSGSLTALAQTDEPTLYRHYPVHHYHGPHHIVHHRFVARHPASAQPGEASESAPPPTNPMFKPYAHPGEGDDDGLSRDPDDCMKGCIGGNPG
jgi:hypothetical protein